MYTLMQLACIYKLPYDPNVLNFRGVDGVRVIYWYHRQFIETAWVRYLASEDKQKKFYTTLAEYFMGKWAGKLSHISNITIYVEQ